MPSVDPTVVLVAIVIYLLRDHIETTLNAFLDTVKSLITRNPT